MSGRQISLVYFYLISAGALALIVIGVFSTVNFIINVSQYEEYPLGYYQEDCSMDPYKYQPRGPYPAEVSMAPMISTPSAQEREEQKKNCEKRVESERKQRRIDDLKSAITFTLVGSVLFLIHFPLARKHSKDK